MTRPHPFASPLVRSMIRRQQRRDALINVLASLIIASMLMAVLIVAGAPTWAWLGFGVVLYWVTL